MISASSILHTLLLLLLYLFLDSFLNWKDSFFSFDFAVAIPTVYIALKKTRFGIALLVLFGFILDLNSGALFGTYMLSCFLCGLLLLSIGKIYVTESYMMLALFVFFSELVVHFSAALIIYVTERLSYLDMVLSQIILYKILPTAIVSIPILMLIEKVFADFSRNDTKRRLW